MHKQFVAASDVRQGDTLCLAAHGQFFIEQVSQQDGKCCLHALNDTHKFIYPADARVRVLRGDDRAVGGSEAAAIEADLVINRLKNSGALRRLDDERALELQLQWGDQ